MTIELDTYNGLIKVGYWYSKYEPELPMPTSMKYRDESRQPILDYLNAGKELAAWRGSSECRVCECRNGSKCLTDGVYAWPQGLAHYVEEHDTTLPEDFVEHILGYKLHRWGYKRCPRCDAISGDSWSQCGGICPLEGSPHYDPEWVKGDLTIYQSSNGWSGDHTSRDRGPWAASEAADQAARKAARSEDDDFDDDMPF